MKTNGKGQRDKMMMPLLVIYFTGK